MCKGYQQTTLVNEELKQARFTEKVNWLALLLHDDPVHCAKRH